MTPWLRPPFWETWTKDRDACHHQGCTAQRSPQLQRGSCLLEDVAARQTNSLHLSQQTLPRAQHPPSSTLSPKAFPPQGFPPDREHGQELPPPQSADSEPPPQGPGCPGLRLSPLKAQPPELRLNVSAPAFTSRPPRGRHVPIAMPSTLEINKYCHFYWV